jgi:Amiloride-sensitive sodium channel
MTSQRSELYGKTDFLANCGGLMGLFLGVSVISLLEIVYFCSIRVCFNRRTDESRIDSEKNLQKTKGLLQILKDLVADYSTKTTIQGINYIADTELSRTERYWWSIVVVISIFFCGSLISDIFMRYRDSPVIINLANEETSIFQIPFPAITVCPQIAAISTADKSHYFNIEKHSLYNLDQDQ